MGPFERLKKIEFYYNDETIQWQLQKSECVCFVCCKHPVFVQRFGHPNIMVQSFDAMFEHIMRTDEDYKFFHALQESANDYPTFLEAE